MAWKPARVPSQDGFALNFAVLASRETRLELIDRMQESPHVEEMFTDVKPWKMW